MPRPKSKNPNTAKVNYMISEEAKKFMEDLAESMGVTESELHRHIVGHVMCSLFQSDKFQKMFTDRYKKIHPEIDEEIIQHVLFQMNQKNFRAMLSPLLPIIGI